MPNPAHEPTGPTPTPLGRPPDVPADRLERLRARVFSKGPRKIRHYELRGVIGRGGFGQVHRAYDTKLRRHVALKELRFSSSSDLIRLEREAQALARLSHPNVVQVHDTGVMGESTYYIVMEYVEGSSLAHWQSIETRPQPALLDQYLQVARGLLAAHRAGLVHRDFKPSNAVVGRDGRTRVLDFGLAKEQAAMPAAESEPLSTESSPSERASRPTPRHSAAAITDDDTEDAGVPPTPAPTDDALTSQRLAVVPDADTELWEVEPSASESSASGRASSADPGDEPRAGEVEPPQTTTGHFKGTPRYASPEQLLGEPLDARSDQFSFCVSLFEAVYGHHPFADENNAVPLLRVVSGNVKWHDAGRAPPWLRRLLRRGLSRRADDRFESLEPIVRELETRLRPRRRWPWVVVAGGIAVGLMVPAVIEQQAQACGEFEDEIAQVWDEGAKNRILEAFGEQQADTAGLVIESFEGYASRWQSERQRACQVEQTAVVSRSSASEDPVAREAASDAIACLEQQRDELAGMVEQLATSASAGASSLIDESSLWQAVPPDPRLCRDLDVARGLARFGGHQSGEDAVRVSALLREARVERVLGHFEASATLAERARTLAEAIGHRPLLAASHYQLGVAQSMLPGSEAEARVNLERAIESAETQELDVLAVEALAQYVRHGTNVRQRSAERADTTALSDSERLALRLAFAKLDALGIEDTELEAWVRLSAGHFHSNRREWEDADAEYQRASVLFGHGLGEDDFITAGVDVNRAAALVWLPERLEEGVALADDALMRRVAAGGEGHPLVIGDMIVTAKIHHRALDFDGALTLYRRALDLVEEREGPGQGEAPWIRLELAQLLKLAGDPEGAVRMLDACERDLGGMPEDERPPDRMLRWAVVARTIATQRGDWERLGRISRAELDLLEHHRPERRRAIAVAALNLHSSQRKLGRPCEAWATFGRYEETITRELGEKVSSDLTWFRGLSDRCNNTKGNEP